MSASAPWWKPSAGRLSTWLDGRLAADIYINATDNAQATDIKAWLRERPEVQAILPGGRAETQLDGAPIEIVGLPDHATYRDIGRCCNRTANAWIRASPRRCRLCQRTAGAAAELEDRRPHRTADAVAATGRSKSIGIYADYGNPKGQVTVNVAALIRDFPAMPQTRLGLRVVPRANPGADVGAAGQIRPRRPQPAGSGDA